MIDEGEFCLKQNGENQTQIKKKKNFLTIISADVRETSILSKTLSAPIEKKTNPRKANCILKTIWASRASKLPVQASCTHTYFIHDSRNKYFIKH